MRIAISYEQLQLIIESLKTVAHEGFPIDQEKMGKLIDHLEKIPAPETTIHPLAHGPASAF